MKKYKPLAGEGISKIAWKIVILAEKTKGKVIANFNGIKLIAKPGDNASSIVEFYEKKSNRIDEEWRKSPEGQHIADEAKESAKKLVTALSEGILPFALKDTERWKQIVKIRNRDCVVRYAARWANLMEKKLIMGAKLEDIANVTSHEADLEGITGSIYGCAVSILSKVWENGEQLRRWHNISTQLHNEGKEANESGGVLDPASSIMILK